MLTYDTQASYSMIFMCLTGSVVPKAAGWALFSSLLTLLFSVGSDPIMRGQNLSTPGVLHAPEDDGPTYIRGDLFEQPYSHYLISYMLGFLMIFRVQLSYSRYWSSRVAMYGRNTASCTTAARATLRCDRRAEPLQDSFAVWARGAGWARPVARSPVRSSRQSSEQEHAASMQHYDGTAKSMFALLS